ncbi:toxin ParE1/3/4 [Singulisphaera sp. GP187]|uniref:type II toxin-antitoxin system RelE/ParE family toxin n=1 Tax=Singulisphaera sp. GP187 TaxID=1882752 RepID=UPI00092B1884|nr:type II toxin-antitoxin system RelE/ParE family toxin [Singulisphaera sp. GP187]SIO23574.1 toxin ParE1/3/4 [Singulisphaera sp. GP187]
MKEPLLTDEAKDDLAEIWATIADARDERTANRIHRKILDACRSKAAFPETGRLREEISPGLRCVVVRPYVAFFRPHMDTIVVLRILHGRRDVESIMSEA